MRNGLIVADALLLLPLFQILRAVPALPCLVTTYNKGAASLLLVEDFVGAVEIALDAAYYGRTAEGESFLPRIAVINCDVYQRGELVDLLSPLRY
jgi:hypothetical protein